MEYISSISPIKHQYSTGEQPVLVECSDYKTWVCKYSRSAGSAYKMACEVIGAMMAEAWEISSPKIKFVTIKRSHIPYP